ncbi:hypothetical protein EI555_011611 [Monodon monoceros]|uniref:Uncharacterized protein n=1 Tax=Monodon monoceros TaxID=40151 RepID=A0A4U1EDQ8_MONMO|nr:hypothetical protein EI555_011611 [Monodon monoceros]
MVQGGVDPREDWDQAAAAAWAPGAPPTSQPVARRCPRPPRLLQARCQCRPRSQAGERGGIENRTS